MAEAKFRSFRKTAAILMLVSFIFGVASPAMAADSAGIAAGVNFTEIGNRRTFGGYDWILYATDSAYGYIITFNTEGHGTKWGTSGKKYIDSNLREAVSGYQGSDLTQEQEQYSVEYKMRNATTTTYDNMTWAEANGTALSKSYITKYDITDGGNTGFSSISEYNDLVYVLSSDEVNALWDLYKNGNVALERALRPGISNYWLLRDAKYANVSKAAYSDLDVHISEASLSKQYYYRPIMKINLQSPLFEDSLFRTAADSKAAVTEYAKFMLPTVTDTLTLTKQTKEVLTYSGTPAVSMTAEDTETVASRISGNVINLTSPLTTDTQLKVTYSDLAANVACDHIAAVVLNGKIETTRKDYELPTAGYRAKYINYAKLSTATAETDLSVDVSNLAANGIYHIYLFAEKINGTLVDPAKSYNATTNPYADAVTTPVYAGYFTLHRGSANAGTLAETYKTSGLTAQLGGSFNLSFTNGEYDTGVTVATGKTGSISAHTSGTTLTGNISVENGSTLTTNRKFTLKGTNVISGAVTGGALNITGGTTRIDTTGSIANALTISTGSTLELNADKYGVSTGVASPTMNGGTVKFTGGTLTQAISGDGNIVIAGNVSSTAANFGNNGSLSVASDTLTLTDGTLSKTITGAGNIAIAGNVSSTAANFGNNGTLSVTSDTLTLTDGTLNKAITNSGTVKLDGAELGGAYITGGTLEFAQDLATNANYVTADINTIDSGITLTLNDGILAKAITNNGTVALTNVSGLNAAVNGGVLNVNQNLTVDADNIKGDTNNVQSSKILTLNAGALVKDVANSGIVKFDAGIGNTVTASGSFTGNGLLEVASGTLNYTGSSIANAVKIYTDATLDPNANVFSGDIENNGTLVLEGNVSSTPVVADTGYLNANITGTGTVQIGDGANPAHVYLGSGKSITAGTLDVKTDAAYTGTLANMTITDITNAGTLNFTGGTLTSAIANSGTVTAKSSVTINNTITNESTASTTLETGSSFGANGKITGGSATLKDGIEFTGKNLSGNALTANNAIYSFGAKLTDDAAGIALSEGSLINVSSAAGTITLGDIAFTGNNYDSWGRTTYRQLKYLAAAGSNNMEIFEAKVAINDGTEYSFNQAYETAGDNTTAKKYGWIDVFKKAAPYTLKQLVNADAIAEATTNDKYILQADETQTETLGNLKRAADKQGMPRSLTITSKEGELHTLNGGGNGGITVAGEGGGADDALKLQNITVKNFSTAVTVNEGGILTMDEVTFEGTTGNADVINNGTLSMGEVDFNKGVKGTGEMVLNDNFTNNTTIEQGKISVTGGKTLANNGTITADIENDGTINTDADKISGSVKNDNLLTLTGGVADETISEDSFAKLGSDVTGEGTTIIDGYVNAADKKLETAVTVNADKGLYIKADGIKKAVANEGLLLLSDGTLAQNITGSGDTSIRGNVENKAEINQNNIVVETGSLTTNANLIKGGLINNETVNFTGGTLEGRYLSIDGTTNFKGKTKFSDKVTLENSTLNFCLDGFAKGDTIVETAEKVDLADTKVGLIQKDAGYKLDKEGDTITLITNAENYEYSEIKTQEGARSYTYSVGIEGDALMLGYLDQGISDHTKSFSEARLAGLAAINSGSDLIATEVMENASAETKEWEAFAAIQGSHSRYETGSHIDLNSTNVAAGLSKKVKDNVTLGLFVEGGNGRYTTYNEFEDNDVRADGDINYFGGGVFAKVEGKKTAKGQLHGEASFRAGHTTSDYNSETFELGKQTRFDTSNAYMGAHLGLGYKWNVKDGGNVDTYVKYLWNRQNSDSIKIEDDTFELDTINSHRLRAGFRYNGKENNKGIKFYGGLAYEYEFDGVASGRMGEYAILEPDFKGGSGMAELGIKYHKANSPWKVELGVTGYTGKRDSIGANLSAWYEFGK